MNQIVKTFKTPAGDFTALKGIQVCFYRGEFVSVVGKSGSGKSTLVNMLTGIDHPTTGSVRFGDTYVHALDENKMSIWRGKNLGIVFQFFQLLPMLSLLENVMLPMDFCNMYAPDERETRAMDLLRLVGLENFAHQLPDAVSGGQQQSAAIARALANDPPILIADEPTGNLDSRTAEAVFQLLNELVEQGKTVIMVTHDSSLAKRTMRSMIISDGELVNEWVARAFPWLPHHRMLWLTHHLQELSLTPGATLPMDGSQPASFYLVTEGQVEIVLNHGRRRDDNSPRLLPGDIISRLDMQAAGDALAGLEAAGSDPLRVLALHEADFDRWMLEAPADHAGLQRITNQHMQAWRVMQAPGLQGGLA
ncbi:MAG: ATP-binding cassette domain-containing protein [Anaerolineales bacterium]